MTKLFAFMMFLNLDSSGKRSEAAAFKLHSHSIRITNSRFRLFDETKSYTNEKGMDYADIDIGSINGYLEDFYVIKDSINSKILMLSAIEKSGISVQNLSSDFSISSHGLKAYNSKLSTELSRLDFDLDFYYSKYSAMSYFIDSV